MNPSASKIHKEKRNKHLFQNSGKPELPNDIVSLKNQMLSWLQDSLKATSDENPEGGEPVFSLPYKNLTYELKISNQEILWRKTPTKLKGNPSQIIPVIPVIPSLDKDAGIENPRHRERPWQKPSKLNPIPPRLLGLALESRLEALPEKKTSLQKEVLKILKNYASNFGKIKCSQAFGFGYMTLEVFSTFAKAKDANKSPFTSENDIPLCLLGAGIEALEDHWVRKNQRKGNRALPNI